MRNELEGQGLRGQSTTMDVKEALTKCLKECNRTRRERVILKPKGQLGFVRQGQKTASVESRWSGTGRDGRKSEGVKKVLKSPGLERERGGNFSPSKGTTRSYWSGSKIAC